VPASHESPAGPAPSVLLVEEYDALAAAIASALKKFAPNHRVRVVESLTEAEASLVESSPLLLIVDFDPPRTDIIKFLERVSAAHSDARMLAIASGVPAAINAQRSGPSAIQFIDKPFELADFGAAVQALLGAWTNASSGDSRGTLRNLTARDLVPLQCLNLATAVLHLRSEDDQAGEIHFLEGQITHAASANFTGVGALHQMMGWKNPRARETERVVDGPRTIQGAWQPVLFEAFRHAAVAVQEEPAPMRAPVPPPIQEPAKPVIKTGKKIVVIDDTEMLLIFVEDAIATADPNLQIVTAFTGSEGLRRAETALPDLLLLDYSLPDLRGDQVCERLLQNQATARIPVVMMSGHVSEMAATARKYRNVVATIAKPFVSEALVSLVKEMLAKGPLPAERPSPRGNGKKPGKKNGTRVAAPPEETPAPPAPRPLPAVTEMPAPIVVPPPIPVAAPAPLAPGPVPAATNVPPPIVAPVPVVVPAPTPVPLIPPLTPLAAANGSTVVVALGMEVLAVQFTPRFRIGAIRARPTFSTLSLSHSSAPGQNLLAGFEVGPVELDPSGRIHTLRVLPTRRPPAPVEVRTRLEIKDIALVNQNASIQLTGGEGAPMTLKLMAVFKVAGVELSDRFEVAQLVLQSAGGRVRVNLDPQSRDAGAEFETVGVRLDSSRRIAEFILSAVAAPKTV
jgi:DNA-binding response OmpR family regulator